MNDTTGAGTVDKNNGTNGKSQKTDKDPATKLAHKRLSALELAESLGNVSAASCCRRAASSAAFTRRAPTTNRSPWPSSSSWPTTTAFRWRL